MPIYCYGIEKQMKRFGVWYFESSKPIWIGTDNVSREENDNNTFGTDDINRAFVICAEMVDKFGANYEVKEKTK